MHHRLCYSTAKKVGATSIQVPSSMAGVAISFVYKLTSSLAILDTAALAVCRACISGPI